MKKVLEFMGSPEMLIALLYSDDVCQTIKDEVRASGKVSLFMFAEDEPYFVPDNDDIQITKTGEDIRPQVNLGEPVQIEDDLHWDEHHEARIDVIGQNGNTGLHYDGWIEWNGGEPPGSAFQNVVVRHRRNPKFDLHGCVSSFDWQHLNGDDDIIAYKFSIADSKDSEVVGT